MAEQNNPQGGAESNASTPSEPQTDSFPQEAADTGPEPTAQELFNYDPFSEEDAGDAAADPVQAQPDQGASPEGQAIGEFAEGSQQQSGAVQQGSAGSPDAIAAAVQQALATAGVTGGQGQGQTPQEEQDSGLYNPANVKLSDEQKAELQGIFGDAKFDVPDQLVQMFDSGDPTQRKAAISTIMTATYQSAVSQVYGLMAHYMGQLPQFIQQQQADLSRRQTVFNDFYGTYPQLNKKELYPVIAQVGNAVAAEMGVQPGTWNPQLRQAIAERVASSLGISLAGNGSGQPKQPSGAITNSGGSRPAGVTDPAANKTDADRMASMLGL